MKLSLPFKKSLKEKAMDKIEEKKTDTKELPRKENFWSFAKAHPFISLASVAVVTNGAVNLTKFILKRYL